jgi:hypothetical protein
MVTFPPPLDSPVCASRGRAEISYSLQLSSASLGIGILLLFDFLMFYCIVLRLSSHYILLLILKSPKIQKKCEN